MNDPVIPYPYPALLKVLLKLLRPYRGHFWLATFLRLSADIVYLYASYALAQMIAFFTHTPLASLNRFWWLMFAWATTHAYVTVARQVAKYLCYGVSGHVRLDSELAAMRHLNQLDISWHEKENTGNKLKRIQNGGMGFDRLLQIWVDNLVEITVNFLGIIIIVAFIDRTVTLIMIAFLISYLFLAIPLARRASKAGREVNQLEENFSGLAFETINNVRSVKVMGMFTRLFTLLEGASDKIFEALRERVYRFRFKSSVQSLWAHAFRVLAMIFIVVGIVRGHYEVGFLLLFNFYFGSLRQSVEELSNISQEIVIARYQITRYQAILAEPIQIDDDTDKVVFPHNWKKVELRNVSFSYGDNVILKNLSLTIRRGEKIGVMGLSGAGKSTLFKLLLKEYENFTGDILFDGLSIRDIKRSSYFQKVAVVLQETEVFNFSLQDNITLASTDGENDPKRLATALETAHVTDFIHKLPQGIETIIGEKGIKLSGGERQRVGIARAIFKQPDLLFLDEATSHLDLESEEKIKDSLHAFFQNVTAVIIAHRLTTIQEMDRIVLMEDGQILEEGNFETLFKKRGRFFQLWEKQKF